MGSSYCRTTTRKECSLTATSRRTSRHDAHEVVGPHVCLVALPGSRHRQVRTTMFALSRTATSTSNGSTPAVEVAIQTVGATSHGFCWSVPGQNDTCGDRLSYEVDRSLPTDSTASSKVIELSLTLFAQFGIP